MYNKNFIFFIVSLFVEKHIGFVRSVNEMKVEDSNWREDEIVISGASGRFPDSNSIKQLKENLMNKTDLVSADYRRWKLGNFHESY